MMKRTRVLVLVIEGLVSHLEPFSFSFFGTSHWGIDVAYCDIEWFSLETNRDHSVIFEIAPPPQSTAFQTLVDYEGNSHLQEKEMQKAKWCLSRPYK